MHTVWAQRREEVLRDCLVSPDIFNQMVDRLDEFVVPYTYCISRRNFFGGKQLRVYQG